MGISHGGSGKFGFESPFRPSARVGVGAGAGINLGCGTGGLGKAYRGNSLGEGKLVESIPAEESFGLWTRMVTIQYIEGTEDTPREMMERVLAAHRSQCPELVSGVIQEDATSVTYEWRIDACPAAPDQHEVARLIEGVDALHRVAYVQKGPVMPADVRQEWIDRLAEAIVLRDGRPIHAPPSTEEALEE